MIFESDQLLTVIASFLTLKESTRMQLICKGIQDKYAPLIITKFVVHPNKELSSFYAWDVQSKKSKVINLKLGEFYFYVDSKVSKDLKFCYLFSKKFGGKKLFSMYFLESEELCANLSNINCSFIATQSSYILLAENERANAIFGKVYVRDSGSWENTPSLKVMEGNIASLASHNRRIYALLHPYAKGVYLTNSAPLLYYYDIDSKGKQWRLEHAYPKANNYLYDSSIINIKLFPFSKDEFLLVYTFKKKMLKIVSALLGRSTIEMVLLVELPANSAFKITRFGYNSAALYVTSEDKAKIYVISRRESEGGFEARIMNYSLDEPKGMKI